MPMPMFTISRGRSPGRGCRSRAGGRGPGPPRGGWTSWTGPGRSWWIFRGSQSRRSAPSKRCIAATCSLRPPTADWSLTPPDVTIYRPGNRARAKASQIMKGPNTHEHCYSFILSVKMTLFLHDDVCEISRATLFFHLDIIKN